jgi:hypothetical protein
MPVLIRESQSPERPDVLEVTYKTAGGVLTGEGEGIAKRNDDVLERRLRAIESEMLRRGLLDLKGRPGVVRLWWEVGRRLTFIEEMDVGDERDRVWLWRAIYDHAGRLNPTRNGRLSVRARRRPRNSYFRYMALLGRLDWSVAEAVGDWTSWVELCDSECFDDGRFIQWLADRARAPESPLERLVEARHHQDLFRKLAKAIRHRFNKTDTSVFSRGELYAELDALAATALGREGERSRG